MRRSLRGALVLLLLLSALGAPLQAATPIRVGIIPISDTLPLYAALDQGYVAAEGIELEITPLTSGARIIEAMAGGSLDLGLSATISVLQAAEQGLDLVIVEPAAFARTDASPTNALMALKSSGIASAADLRGKVIGVNALRTIGHLAVAEFLAKGGVSSEQVTWQELPFPQMLSALELRRVDAVNVVEPFLTVLKDSGKAVILASYEDTIPGMSVSVYTALRAWYTGHADAIQAFDRAYKKGVEFCTRNPDRAREILTKYTKTPPEMAQRMTLQLYRPAIVPADLQALIERARRHRLLGQGVDTERILAPTARPR